MFRLLYKQESCNLRACKIGKYVSDIKCSCLNCIRRKSYYQVLGLNSTASSKDIKSAYYNLSLQFHPDKNSGCPDSVAKFREITEAYEILSNAEKKKSYDQSTEFKPHYSPRNYTAQGHYYKPYGKHSYQRPFSGKTKDFDYDEHFRQHYYEYEKQRQREFEYFKRRWEAQFNRRYPNQEDYSWKENKRSDHDYSKEEFAQFYPNRRKRTFYFLIPFWCLLILVPFINVIKDPDRPKRYSPPIYYKVKHENDEVK